MQIAIRNIGNSKGVVLPKPLLAQVGLADQVVVEISVEHGAIVLKKPPSSVREGWAKAAADIAARGDDALLIGEFGNIDDAGLVW